MSLSVRFWRGWGRRGDESWSGWESRSGSIVEFGVVITMRDYIYCTETDFHNHSALCNDCTNHRPDGITYHFRNILGDLP